MWDINIDTNALSHCPFFRSFVLQCCELCDDQVSLDTLACSFSRFMNEVIHLQCEKDKVKMNLLIEVLLNTFYPECTVDCDGIVHGIHIARGF
jgi:hypothetical protein